jgi:hypothetical protein
MKEFFKKIDFIGGEIGFNFGRKDRFQTCLGGVLTILVYALIITVTIIFGKNLFTHGDIDISQSSSHANSNPKIYFAKNNIYPIVGLFRG